jgi:hypothetical protein
LRSGIDQVVCAFLFAGVQRGKWNRTFLSSKVPVAIQQNGAKPSEEMATAIISTQAFPTLHQCVLRQIFRQCILAAQRHRLSEKTRFVRTAQLAEGVRITGLRSREQVGRDCLIRFHENCGHSEHS